MKLLLCGCVLVVVVMSMGPPVLPVPVVARSNYRGKRANNPPFISPPCNSETTLICRHMPRGDFEACMNPRAAREQIRLGHATLGECPKDPCDFDDICAENSETEDLLIFNGTCYTNTNKCPAACGDLIEANCTCQDGTNGSNGQNGAQGPQGNCTNCPLQQNIKACCYVSISGSFPDSNNASPLPFLSQIIWLARQNCAPEPFGFDSCDGRLLGTFAFQNLFSLMGTKYGGDGRETFALPDTTGMKGIVNMMP